jgi:hypothetical protein
VKDDWTPHLVVSDFSLAYLHGVSSAFCDMNLYSYINMKYDHMLDLTAAKGYEGTNLFVCSGHFLHFVSKFTRRKSNNKEAISVAMHSFARLIEARTREEYEDITTEVITLFGRKFLELGNPNSHSKGPETSQAQLRRVCLPR